MRDSGSGDPEAADADAHAFVVKLWREDTGRAGRAAWRGSITHVPSGERHYVTRIGQFDRVFVRYLAALQAPLPWHWRMWWWWMQRREL